MCLEMDEARLAEDEATLEGQCPGVMGDFTLWCAQDGQA